MRCERDKRDPRRRHLATKKPSHLAWPSSPHRFFPLVRLWRHPLLSFSERLRSAATSPMAGRLLHSVCIDHAVSKVWEKPWGVHE